MKTGRTNSTTKYREAASEKLGREQMQRADASTERGNCVHREGRETGHATRELIWGKLKHITFGFKNQRGLIPGVCITNGT